jgi:hypothetical protein
LGEAPSEAAHFAPRFAASSATAARASSSSVFAIGGFVFFTRLIVVLSISASSSLRTM